MAKQANQIKLDNSKPKFKVGAKVKPSYKYSKAGKGRVLGIRENKSYSYLVQYDNGETKYSNEYDILKAK